MSAHHLLVVEDHADTLKILGLILRKQGYQVFAASSCAEAIAACEGNSFDACISDIGLADCDGLDLMRQLIAKYQIKGIACSGYGYDTDIERAKKAGFSAYVVKPFDCDVLFATIKRVLELPDPTENLIDVNGLLEDGIHR